MAPFRHVEVREEGERGAAWVTFSNPPLNVITGAVARELRETLARLRKAEGLRCLILSGKGAHFSAGADVGEHLPPHHEALLREFGALLDAVDTFPAPTLAVVRGRCLGGGFELVQRCDLVLADRDALFGQPEIRLGVTAPFASAVLPRVLPRGRAMALLLTGASISAAEAEEAGLVWRAVPGDGLEEAVEDAVETLSGLSAAALRLAKESARAGQEGSPADAASRCLALYLGPVMETEDALEGLRAFLEKRPPRWRHR